MATAPATVRVTLGQVVVGPDHGAARATALSAVDAAQHAGARLVVLPEYASGFDPRGVGPEHAEPLDGPFVSALRERARATATAVIAGTTLPGHRPDRAVNAVVAIGADGAVAGVYRKVHLYDAFGHRESERLEPGAADAPPLVLDVGPLRFGVMTCYDLRFPESARRLVDAGAHVLVVPAAWVAGPGKAAQWEALAVARAIENTSAVLAVGQAGRGVTGTSLAVAADGRVLERLGAGPGTLTVDLDGAAITAVRDRNPSLANRRYAVVPR
ncbi:carbon-nitrogen hydrolase family protein [Cellulomonas sp. ATA003]|uniref:carbon-nitrogen hydrolase family protein n=1 Tax=Cellulomonas sp. ATA003 TaxID=3073064 RepID=UPI002872E78A|nr:carbon-nitrogen hydrolase family protein [Cellulomonas sp. ATA003]WNB87569.1 carbon-nitrogen hydrolase family protein [Cellulomonas sp. ATA003]